MADESSGESATPAKTVTASIDAAGTNASLAIHNAILANPLLRTIGDFLHGGWLGHPLHPLFTDITISAWLLGSAADAIAAATDRDDLRELADRLTELGELSAIPTALTGATDFSTFPEWSATPATLHAALNVVNIGLYAWSIRERRAGNRSRGVLISSIALGLTCVSAWLGGVLVYKHRVGVSHADRFEGENPWTAVIEMSQLPDQQLVTVTFKQKPVLVWREGIRSMRSPTPARMPVGHCTRASWWGITACNAPGMTRCSIFAMAASCTVQPLSRSKDSRPACATDGCKSGSATPVEHAPAERAPLNAPAEAHQA